jgi:hypothetical protein
MTARFRTSVALVLLALPAAAYAQDDLDLLERLKREKPVEVREPAALEVPLIERQTLEESRAKEAEQILDSTPKEAQLEAMRQVEASKDADVFTVERARWNLGPLSSIFTEKQPLEIHVEEAPETSDEKDGRLRVTTLDLDSGQVVVSAFRSGTAPVEVEIDKLGLTARQTEPSGVAGERRVQLEAGGATREGVPGEILRFPDRGLSVQVEVSADYTNTDAMIDGAPFALRIRAWTDPPTP